MTRHNRNRQSRNDNPLERSGEISVLRPLRQRSQNGLSDSQFLEIVTRQLHDHGPGEMFINGAGI